MTIKKNFQKEIYLFFEDVYDFLNMKEVINILKNEYQDYKYEEQIKYIDNLIFLLDKQKKENKDGTIECLLPIEYIETYFCLFWTTCLMTFEIQIMKQNQISKTKNKINKLKNENSLLYKELKIGELKQQLMTQMYVKVVNEE